MQPAVFLYKKTTKRMRISFHYLNVAKIYL